MDENCTLEYIKSYFSYKSEINEKIVEYLESGEEEKSQKINILLNILKSPKNMSKKQMYEGLLLTVTHLSKEHQPTKMLLTRVEEIISTIKNEIREIFTVDEITRIFQPFKNICILLILVQNSLIDLNCYLDFLNQKIIKFLYPEIRDYSKEYLDNQINEFKYFMYQEFIDENDQNLELFFELRKEGENPSLMSKLIRDDLIDEFISYVENNNISITAFVNTESVFTRASALRSKNPSPFEYSALFGSIKIFKYLLLKKCNDTDIILEFAIQGRNYEIIHILEGKDTIQKDINENLFKYLQRAIICHHNEIVDYFLHGQDLKEFPDLIDTILSSNNYQLLNKLIQENRIDLANSVINNKIFRYYCLCENSENSDIVGMLSTLPSIDINFKNDVILYYIFRNINSYLVIYLYKVFYIK